MPDAVAPRVLVVNCGSSSIAADVVDVNDREDPVLRSDSPPTDAAAQDDLAAAVRSLPEVDVVAHRLVHGGEQRHPTVLDGAEIARLRSLEWLAPLHLPPALETAEAVARILPDVPTVACFDTELHATLDPSARALPIPARWRDEHGFERYGFHGPGHAWAIERTAALLDRPPAGLNMVTAHLGGGASAAAVRGGTSVDTTMGLTPLAGMAMTTRTGSLDPGMLLRLVETGSSAEELADEAARHAGMLGLSRSSSDLRDLYPVADRGDADARLAVDVYVRGIAHGIAAMATALDHVDAVAFTGGAGAGSARLRAEVCGRLGVLGVEIDPARNDTAAGEALVHERSSAVAIAVVPAHESIVIARSARAALALS